MENASEAQYKKMLETPVPKLVSSLAVPTVLSMMITTIYNMADTYFVSQISTSASAAVGVVFSLMSLIQAVGFGFGTGCGSLVSLRLGAKKNKEASRFGSSAFFAAIVFGLVLMIFGLSTLKWLMRLLGSTETMLPYSCGYAFYILLGAPMMCSSFVLNNVLRSEGQAVKAMVGMCLGGLLNIGLDPLFIFVFNWGISGAAIATLCSQLLSFGILIYFFLSGKTIVRIGLSRVSRSASDYGLIIATGFPTICRQGLASVASALMNVQAAVYGDAAVAAITISNRVYLLVRNIILGFGQGFQPAAGYNFGAGRPDRVKSAFRFTTIVGTVFCFAACGVLFAYAGDVMRWFRDDEEVIRIGTKALYFACAVIPFMAFSTYVNQMYQCLGFKVQATLLASCRQGIFFIPYILLLPLLTGLTGVQMAQPLADLSTFFISIPFYIVFYRRHLRIFPETAGHII